MKQLIEIDTDSQVVVPREPTTEMIDKAYKLGADAHVSEIYQLMLDSAPQPQEQAVQEDEQLRFKSACEISGPKHPEYVKGYEAAMDAVSKAQEQAVQPSEVPTGHVYLPEITPEMWEMLGDTDVMDWIDGPQWTQIAVDFASVLPVKMPEKPAQAVAVPIPTSERLPTVGDGDPHGLLLAFSLTSKVWHIVKFYDVNRQEYSHWISYLRMPQPPESA